MKCKKLFPVILCTVLLAGCSFKPKLIIYTADKIIPQEILAGFEKETGHKILNEIYTGTEAIFAKLHADKKGNYGLVIADDYTVENIISEKLAQKIDRSRLNNYRNINPAYQKQFYDPADEYTIPYGARVYAIVCNPKIIETPIRSYLDLWHPVLAGKVGLIDNFRVINGMGLKIMGESFNCGEMNQIRTSGELLSLLAPNIRVIGDNQVENELISGGISVALVGTPQAKKAKTEKPELKVIYPQEGPGINLMAIFIPAGLQKTDAAYVFLDYILDAKRGAACFEFLGLHSTFTASDQFINEKYREFLTLPAEFGQKSLEIIQKISPEAEALHNRIWTEFKSAAGQK